MTCDLMFDRIFDPPWINVDLFSLKYKLYSKEKKHHIAHADVWCRPSECNQIIKLNHMFGLAAEPYLFLSPWS